ncbi:hypothetical protein [Sebaldella sp. S0638]|uniref:hypothetical protein n=1 Tax=Sebaldella sp. S0638 TaxID=2957809 RepID=UPI00209D9516|nr:hypothetical protein [Sebaldella sp. S0638]MCP1226125.1 hypothetical protein [Sebaldella sp. S0638]
MRKQKMFIEYIKSQKETIKRLAKSEIPEKEEILKELNHNIEEQELSVNIQELNGRIVFVPIGKERFKARILYDFLQKIFGEKYTDEFWRMMEETENKNYVSIDNFFRLAEKIKDNEEELTGIPGDTEGIKKLILSVYQNIRNREFSEALKGYKKLSEENKELFEEKLKKNLDNLLTGTYSAMETDEYKMFSETGENILFLECLNKCKDFMTEDTEKFLEKEEVSDITGKTTGFETEHITVKEEKKENQIFEESISKREKSYFKKTGKKEELKPKSIKELMGETIQLFENHNFDEAVQNIKLLAEVDEVFIKNDTELKYLLEAVLLRTGRFFLQRKMEYKKYWGYFLGKYETKIEFYQNIVKLRKCTRKNWKLHYHEEYEVWRRD